MCLLILLLCVNLTSNAAETPAEIRQVSLRVIRINCYGQDDSGGADEVSFAVFHPKFERDSAYFQNRKFKETSGSITFQTRRRVSIPLFKGISAPLVKRDPVIVNLRELDGGGSSKLILAQLAIDLAKQNYTAACQRAVANATSLFNSEDDNYGTFSIQVKSANLPEPTFFIRSLPAHKEAAIQILSLKQPYDKLNTVAILGLDDGRGGLGNLQAMSMLKQATEFSGKDGKVIFCVFYYFPGQEKLAVSHIPDQNYLVFYELTFQ